MLSSCTYFKALCLGTWGVWNCDFLSLPVAAFFFRVRGKVVCLFEGVYASALPMRKTHYTVKLVG